MMKQEVYAIDARMIESSGIGTYIRMIMRKGTYTVALGDEQTIHQYFPNVFVIPFHAKIYGIKEQIHFPYKELEKRGVKVFHSPHYNVPILWRHKLVVTIHDLIHIKFPEYLPNKWALLYAKAMLQWDCIRASKIFAVSEYTRDDIVKSLYVKKEKIEVTYNTVEDCFISKKHNEIQYLYVKYRIPSDSKIILYVGNIKPHKNVSAIVEAFRKINIPNAWLVMVGRAFEQNVKERLGIGEDIESRATLTGEVTKEEVVDWYNLADVFVFPSFYEGFGIPPLEAMACGTPVICSNAASLPEVVGDAAIMINPESIEELQAAIEYIVNMEEMKRQEIITKGYERVGYFKKMIPIRVIEDEHIV